MGTQKNVNARFDEGPAISEHLGEVVASVAKLQIGDTETGRAETLVRVKGLAIILKLISG
jgi:hypothetical protein